MISFVNTFLNHRHPFSYKVGWKQKVGVGILLGALGIWGYTVYKDQQSQIDKQKESISNLEKKIEEINTSDQTQNETSANLQKVLEELSGTNKELSELVNGLLNNPLINRDVRDLYLKMVIPTVRVESVSRKNETEIGSGTILNSFPGEGGKFYSYILTAAHVIEDQDPDKLIKIYEFDWGQNTHKIHNAKLIASSRRNGLTDLAVLEIVTDTKKSFAKLISKENINSLKIFDRVYNVGCPSGIPPLPTYGELVRKDNIHIEEHWMISATGTLGSSGGGIYLERTRELFGVFHAIEVEEMDHEFHDKSKKIKIKDHEVLIYNLGIIISPSTIYSWLDNQGLQFIYDDNHTREQWINSKKK